jgi:hypothetical protein
MDKLIIIEEETQMALQKIFSSLIKTGPPAKKKPRKPWGQSLVEVALAFPILIMLFGGVVEFGFIINYYLSLLDATREAARVWSGDDPFTEYPIGSGTMVDDDLGFYKETALWAQKALDPSLNYANPADYKGRRIPLDPNKDDVIVSVYGMKNGDAVLARDAGPYHLFPTPGSVSGNYPSLFNETGIEGTHIGGAPKSGLLVVEVHYNYYQVLQLPWMLAFINNPLHLQAYTIMPIRAGEPP